MCENFIKIGISLQHLALFPPNWHSYTFGTRSGGGIADNTLDYKSRDRKMDPQLLRSFG